MKYGSPILVSAGIIHSGRLQHLCDNNSVVEISTRINQNKIFNVNGDGFVHFPIYIEPFFSLLEYILFQIKNLCMYVCVCLYSYKLLLDLSSFFSCG